MYDISLWQLALIAVAAMLTAVIGGVAGYGTGALMPLILVPIVGAEPVVPIIALAALFSNASRAIVFAGQLSGRGRWSSSSPPAPRARSGPGATRCCQDAVRCW